MKNNNKPVYNKQNTQNIRDQINQWITSTNPTHFLSVQFPPHKRKSDLDLSKKTLRLVLKNFQRHLLKRHWNKKSLPFIAVAEKGDSPTFHFHVLFYAYKYTKDQIQVALNKTLDNMNLPPETLVLKPIEETPYYVHSYCTKEIVADVDRHFNSDRIIFSEELFDLPVKK